MIVLLLRRKPVVFLQNEKSDQMRVNYCPPFALRPSDLKKPQIVYDKHIQKWNLQKSASDGGVKIEFTHLTSTSSLLDPFYS